MATSSSPTRDVIKMDNGEIPELTDFFKRTIVTEADRKAYHDLGWLSGNLISFIPEVDVPTVEGSTVLCFECQLAAGLGLPPSKFLSSVMSYLGCSLVHLNADAVSALSSFAMLCECWLGIPPDTSLFRITILPPDTPRPFLMGSAFLCDVSTGMNISKPPSKTAGRGLNKMDPG